MDQPPGLDNTHSVVAISSIFEVPPEVWTIVATLSNRQSVAHFCVVSRHFYSMFSLPLYQMTSNPPLTSLQSYLLMKTIREARKPHPALLVGSLSIPRYELGFRKNDARKCQEVLKTLVENSPSSRGARLRALEWDLSTGIDELGTLLRTPGYFLNLKEISVRSSGRNTGFEFLLCPYLENIECSLTLDRAYGFCPNGAYESWGSIWDALGEAIRLLPLYSPLLHTLKLEFRSSPFRDSDTPPWDAYRGLVATINQTHFPALTSLQLSVKSDFDPPGPEVDFSPLLVAHPLLVTVALLDVDKLRILADSDDANLPSLCSFTGPVEHVAVICPRAPQLASISLTNASEDPEDYVVLDLPPHLFHSNIGPTVTSLEYTSDSDTGGYYFELSVDSVTSLVSAFPNIKHLDIRICEDVNYRDSLASLSRLEYLCLHCEKHIEYSDWDKPATASFPPTKYAAVINELLPLLSGLSDVHLLFRGHRFVDPDPTGCDSCDEYAQATAPARSAVLLEYRLYVNRGGSGEAFNTKTEFVEWCGDSEHCDYTTTVP
ncbi:hypothetical protein B0H19DRAFT_1261844 [Mycena capillaripes]|nr:hypothetical protein B0H19DRAFT_1261844 [Mycena capillaripes]